jgi:hypothetical protein
MSPITTRGARGCAALYAPTTCRIARIVRSFPKRRFASFGLLSVAGFQVTQSAPSTGSWVPSTRRPEKGSPIECAWV